MHLLLLTLVASTPYDVDPVADGVVIGSSLVFSVMLELVVKPSIPGGPACGVVPCDRDDLNALDRGVVDNDSEAWRAASNAGATAALVIPALAIAGEALLEDGAAPWKDALTDATVVVEAASVALAGSLTLKYAVRRPRPIQYRPGVDLSDVEEQVSFPSAHTAWSTAAVTAWATTFVLRHPDSPWRWVVGSGAAAVVGVTAYGRVGAGKHFWTDVIAGAVLGGAVGILVPWLHQSDVPLALAATPQPGGTTVVAVLGW